MVEEENSEIGKTLLKLALAGGIVYLYARGVKNQKIKRQQKKKLNDVLLRIRDDLIVKLDDPDFELCEYQEQINTDAQFYQIIKDQ